MSEQGNEQPLEMTVDINVETDVDTTVEIVELDRYECRACGYVYEPEKGDDKRDIPAGRPFEELPINWRCPVCSAKKAAFANIGPAGLASGFKENLGFGLGVNNLTPTQKIS